MSDEDGDFLAIVVRDNVTGEELRRREWRVRPWHLGDRLMILRIRFRRWRYLRRQART